MDNELFFNTIHVKIINLAHRDDRKSDSIYELKRNNITHNEQIFFKGKYTKENGALGCALSHGMALSDFLYNTDLPYALILEDDFIINNEIDFHQKISKIINKSDLWHVFLLGHNRAIPIEGTEIEDVQRVINSQTMCGYLVSREYTPTLISTFFQSAHLLKKYENLCEPNHKHAKHYFCCDIYWKKLQIENVFWATFPALIRQKESFSDIEKRVVNYELDS